MAVHWRLEVDEDAIDSYCVLPHTLKLAQALSEVVVGVKDWYSVSPLQLVRSAHWRSDAVVGDTDW
jgi:hypothetical protein